MPIIKLTVLILLLLNLTIYASAELAPTPIESAKIEGQIKDIQWSEDGGFLLVLSTDDIFYIYQLQHESSAFTLNLYNTIDLNCNDQITNFKPLQNKGIIIVGCFDAPDGYNVSYYDYDKKAFRTIAQMQHNLYTSISLGSANEFLVISSYSKIIVLAVDGFDLLLSYDISDFYAARRNLPYITGMILDDNSSRIIISTSDGLLLRIDYNGYVSADKNEIAIQEVGGINGFGLGDVYFELDLAMYDDETLVVGGSSEISATLWDLEDTGYPFPICRINTFSYVQDMFVSTDYDLIGFIDGRPGRYLVFVRCVDGESIDIYRMDLYSKGSSIHLSWNSTWNLFAISTEKGVFQLWTL